MLLLYSCFQIGFLFDSSSTKTTGSVGVLVQNKQPSLLVLGGVTWTPATNQNARNDFKLQVSLSFYSEDPESEPQQEPIGSEPSLQKLRVINVFSSLVTKRPSDKESF